MRIKDYYIFKICSILRKFDVFTIEAVLNDVENLERRNHGLQNRNQADD